MLTWLNPGIHTFHGTESLLNLIFFFKSSVWYLSLPAVGVGTFTYVYTQLILFSFSGLQCQIIVSCCCHQLYLARSNATLDSCCLATFDRKGNLSYFYGNMSASIDFKLFPFQFSNFFLSLLGKFNGYLSLELELQESSSHCQCSPAASSRFPAMPNRNPFQLLKIHQPFLLDCLAWHSNGSW